MSDVDNWRPEIDAEDYFGHQKKRLSLADRRPVIRTAADLVGPGVNSFCTRIENFSDPIATYNGWFSALADTPNAPLPEIPFVGYVISDAEEGMGGVQRFTAMETYSSVHLLGTQYQRLFYRRTGGVIHWMTWQRIGASLVAI